MSCIIIYTYAGLYLLPAQASRQRLRKLQRLILEEDGVSELPPDFPTPILEEDGSSDASVSTEGAAGEELEVELPVFESWEDVVEELQGLHHRLSVMLRGQFRRTAQASLAGASNQEEGNTIKRIETGCDAYADLYRHAGARGLREVAEHDIVDTAGPDGAQVKRETHRPSHGDGLRQHGHHLCHFMMDRFLPMQIATPSPWFKPSWRPRMLKWRLPRRARQRPLLQVRRHLTSYRVQPFCRSRSTPVPGPGME